MLDFHWVFQLSYDENHHLFLPARWVGHWVACEHKDYLLPVAVTTQEAENCRKTPAGVLKAWSRMGLSLYRDGLQQGWSQQVQLAVQEIYKHLYFNLRIRIILSLLRLEFGSQAHAGTHEYLRALWSFTHMCLSKTSLQGQLGILNAHHTCLPCIPSPSTYPSAEFIHLVRIHQFFCKTCVS